MKFVSSCMYKGKHVHDKWRCHQQSSPQARKHSWLLSHGENLRYQREVCIYQLCKMRPCCHPPEPLEISEMPGKGGMELCFTEWTSSSGCTRVYLDIWVFVLMLNPKCCLKFTHTLKKKKKKGDNELFSAVNVGLSAGQSWKMV